MSWVEQTVPKPTDAPAQLVRLENLLAEEPEAAREYFEQEAADFEANSHGVARSEDVPHKGVYLGKLCWGVIRHTQMWKKTREVAEHFYPDKKPDDALLCFLRGMNDHL